ncbi:hypothetical protein ABLE92_21880 [Gordonia sp. VNQ95]|jgi:hypothetical protein|uniref:hypothetical protein n=1 Tax=Gordonia TaxID=2053 RepID=UPI0032B3F6AA
MTTSRAALTTIPTTLSDGALAHIIGRVDAFPGHPGPGTPVEPLTTGTSEPVTDLDAPLFALVSVTWATEVTTVNAHTGTSHTKYVPGLLGSPSGTSWYLAPVTPGEHGFTLTGRHAAGHRTATLPDLDGIDAPRQVKVHDFALHR